MKQLHPGAKWAFRISGFFSSIFIAFFLGLFFSGIFAADDGDGFFVAISSVASTILIIFILFLILVEVYARLSYRFFKYEFTEDQLRVEKGIVWKKYSNIPYQRIQNVDIARGIIARIFGFSSVNLQTAGYSMPANGRGMHSEGYLPAVSIDEAEKIREFIIKKISKRKDSGL